MRHSSASICVLLAVSLAPPRAHAHPVPKESHDRTLVVRLARAGDDDKVIVTVAYRLEVDEWTVLEKDMPPFADEAPFDKFGRGKLDAFYGEFTRIYAPILARKLRADLDGQPLSFVCVQRAHAVRDEQGQLLGHLRCDFEFQAAAPVTPGTPHRFQFREGNYLTQTGSIDVSFTTVGGLRLLDNVVPSAELKKRAVNFLGPGDDDRLREIGATFELTRLGTAIAKAAPESPAPAPLLPRAQSAGEDHADLFQIFLHSDHAFWMLLLIAAWAGAVHALTPGHGKTLIAAYLIGERGTVWHALVLGLVTTVTHTAVVILVALGLWLCYPAGIPSGDSQALQTTLQVVMGLLVACMGVWLLLRRLSGRADHVHLGGPGHHHHHDHAHADHDHDAEGNAVPRKEPVGWWGLIVMGMSGGIVPCWDAILVLLLAVGMNELWLALPLVLAFSAGLASVLVLIGILVVRFRGFASSRWGEGRFVRALPILSAVAVTLLGFWLCYAAVHSRPPQGHAARAADARP